MIIMVITRVITINYRVIRLVMVIIRVIRLL